MDVTYTKKAEVDVVQEARKIIEKECSELEIVLKKLTCIQSDFQKRDCEEEVKKQWFSAYRDFCMQAVQEMFLNIDIELWNVYAGKFIEEEEI